MKIVRTETETKTKTIEAGMRCDLCKETVDNPTGWFKQNYSDLVPSLFYTTRFEASVSESLPGYYVTHGLRADFCPKCAKSVVEALKALGVELEEFEYER
jgi:hypothetical protein